jgi:hypothetical protein
MHDTQTRGLRVLVPFFLVLAFSIQLAGQAKPSGNFVKQVLDHKADVTWITYKAPTIPDDVCTILSVCGGAPAKVAALPPATIGARKVGRALFLTQVKNQPAILLEHQVPGREIYFFLLAPDGSVQKTAYIEEGKSFIVIANSLGQSILNGDMKDWSAWAAKLGTAKAPEKGN